ncbi:hypothetical protein ACQEU5_18590 [Marinactinospora thermotolerans]|uniref:Uncharacterized protein n=1 Tax=Marinactinospora thermotolerans DSM 45154 TaxID=1122192 RepID=A0A1T4T674_9ACTN|nr:hypothetical protein [Marinactinospora thermotolerans]SKA35799.1 hypothetical protein SAMN02745673_04539 [Marinactinospora thermotolerans DSM 45154]
MTLAAILRGLNAAGSPSPVLDVRVGGDPTRILNRYAPGWENRARLVDAQDGFDTAAGNALGDLRLDPHYEAKSLPFLREGDLLWAVGIRASALT